MRDEAQKAAQVLRTIYELGVDELAPGYLVKVMRDLEIALAAAPAVDRMLLSDEKLHTDGATRQAKSTRRK